MPMDATKLAREVVDAYRAEEFVIDDDTAIRILCTAIVKHIQNNAVVTSTVTEVTVPSVMSGNVTAKAEGQTTGSIA
jgi:hypothetical protein